MQHVYIVIHITLHFSKKVDRIKSWQVPNGLEAIHISKGHSVFKINNQPRKCRHSQKNAGLMDDSRRSVKHPLQLVWVSGNISDLNHFLYDNVSSLNRQYVQHFGLKINHYLQILGELFWFVSDKSNNRYPDSVYISTNNF